LIVALDNGAIDAAALPEPNATIAERAGYAVRIMGNDQIYPSQQLTVLMYGGPFIANRRDVAQKFMLAYLKGVRFYNDALVNGHLRGRTANERDRRPHGGHRHERSEHLPGDDGERQRSNGRLNVAEFERRLCVFSAIRVC